MAAHPATAQTLLDLYEIDWRRHRQTSFFQVVLVLRVTAHHQDVARFIEVAHRPKPVVHRAVRGTGGLQPPAPAGVSGSSGPSCGGVVGDLLARYFGDVLAWATRIVKRESGCSPGAANSKGCDSSGRTNSHALGVWQMCYPQHASTFAAVGCQAPLDAECNIKAARALYNAAGRAPWGG